MTLLNSKCSDVRRNLTRRDQLGAVERGLLDIHLRRCEECAHIAEDFSKIERGEVAHAEMTEESQRELYKRLVPAVCEITSRVPVHTRGIGTPHALGLNAKQWMVALATFSVAAAVVSFLLIKFL